MLNHTDPQAPTDVLPFYVSDDDIQATVAQWPEKLCLQPDSDIEITLAKEASTKKKQEKGDAPIV